MNRRSSAARRDGTNRYREATAKIRAESGSVGLVPGGGKAPAPYHLDAKGNSFS
jgi:hypothetical protein